jgi:hypothetical protein
MVRSVLEQLSADSVETFILFENKTCEHLSTDSVETFSLFEKRFFILFENRV